MENEFALINKTAFSLDDRLRELGLRLELYMRIEPRSHESLEYLYGVPPGVDIKSCPPRSESS